MKNIKNRKQFLQALAGISLSTTLGSFLPKDSFASVSNPGLVRNSPPPSFIIDSHIHYGTTATWVEDVVKNYRPRNAMACAIAYVKDMGVLKEAIQSYPDVFIGYGRVLPDNPAAVREIETFKKNGFKGIKFHFPQQNWDDPVYFQLYRLCEEYKMHMLFHTGISAHTISDEPQWTSASRMRPMYLDTLARLFPRATIQGAHFGNPWYDEAAEAARWNPNLFFDVTGSTLYKFIKLNELSRMNRILWWSSEESAANPHTLKGGPEAWEHIVFGTDEVPNNLQSNIDRFEKMFDENNVSTALREKIYGHTMAKILGIDVKTKKSK
ncbi:amidohydrolase family protein [Daejeonella sp.]|uniref:amidohydrolase family protein n=1 Tax=Daejeonella sp. TaxID=2805397 RepID=UPI0030C61089